MKTCVIKSSWLNIHSDWSAPFWFAVNDHLKHLHINPRKATQEQVRKAVAAVLSKNKPVDRPRRAE